MQLNYKTLIRFLNIIHVYVLIVLLKHLIYLSFSFPVLKTQTFPHKTCKSYLPLYRLHFSNSGPKHIKYISEMFKFSIILLNN